MRRKEKPRAGRCRRGSLPRTRRPAVRAAWTRPRATAFAGRPRCAPQLPLPLALVSEGAAAAVVAVVVVAAAAVAQVVGAAMVAARGAEEPWVMLTPR